MIPFRTSAVAAAVVLSVGVAAACSSQGSSNGAVCPNDLPASCPTPPPSFAKDVEPVFERRCWPCHTGAGIAAEAHDFSTYDNIFADRSTILNRVFACEMPPADSAQPTPEERAALLAWLVCKAPNN
jgi:uncharacterized membrane protein